MVIGLSKKLMELNENKVCYKYKLIIHDYFWSLYSNKTYENILLEILG